jgi:hypothetical protein
MPQTGIFVWKTVTTVKLFTLVTVFVCAGTYVLKHSNPPTLKHSLPG